MELYKQSRDADAERIVISNSETIAECAFYLEDTGGADEVDAVANPARGLVMGFVDKDGRALGSGYATYDGTFTQANTGNIYAAAADNITVDGIRVLGHRVEAGEVYTAELDDDINTTTGSGVPGYYISVLTTDATKLDESTASSSKQHFKLVDNGTGNNSAQNPDRNGNWVLFEVVEIQDLTPQA